MRDERRKMTKFKTNLIKGKVISPSSGNNEMETKKQKNEEKANQITEMEDDEYKGNGNRFQLFSTEENEILERIRENNITKLDNRMLKSPTQNRMLNSPTQDNRMLNSLTDNGTLKTSTQDKITSTNKEKEEERQKKVQKLPPIFIHNQSLNDTINLIKNVLKIKEFNVKRYSNYKHALTVKNKEDYENTKAALAKVAAQHYTYTPKGSRPQTLLLKGLDPDSSTEEIM